MKDVTVEIFGTKNKQGAEAMNPPVSATGKKLSVSAETLDGKSVLSAEVTGSLKALDKLFRDEAKNFVAIGYELYWFQQTKKYKELGYNKFEDFIVSEMKLSKSAAYNFINVCAKFSVRGDDGKPTKVLAKEYSRYSSSQLVVMLSLDKDKIISIDPETSTREIKKLTASKKTVALSDSSDSDFDASGDDSGEIDASNSKKVKKNVRDATIPVFRISMATGTNWADVCKEDIRKVCETYLNDEKRAADGNDYRIEICITYPDKSAI